MEAIVLYDANKILDMRAIAHAIAKKLAHMVETPGGSSEFINSRR